MEKVIAKDTRLIAACGLYCAACGKYLKGKCPGCKENTKATWCKIRICCSNRGIKDCAQCAQFSDVNKCGLYNNFIARVFGFIFGTDRSKCIELIKKNGANEFIVFMTEHKFQSIPKKFKIRE